MVLKKLQSGIYATGPRKPFNCCCTFGFETSQTEESNEETKKICGNASGEKKKEP
jgi:hypothetical protein